MATQARLLSLQAHPISNRQPSSNLYQHQRSSTMMQRKDPWQWLTIISIVVLLWIGWEWRNHEQQATLLQKELTALERDYRTTLSKLKKTREQQKRLQYDVDQMTAENAQLEQTIRDNEGSNIMIQQYTDNNNNNIDHEKYAQDEHLEELYLTRIDELQEQIRAWNQKLLYREYIFRNRFPHFIITCRVLGGSSNNGTKKTQDVMFKVRLPNIQMFPVEISSLSQMVKQQDCNGVLMRFRKTHHDNNNQQFHKSHKQSSAFNIIFNWIVQNNEDNTQSFH